MLALHHDHLLFQKADMLRCSLYRVVQKYTGKIIVEYIMLLKAAFIYVLRTERSDD